MNYVQFGNNKVAAVTDANGNYNLSVNYTSGWTLSGHPFVWKGFPLASYEDGHGNYSLAVVLEAGSLNKESYAYKGNRYGCSKNSSGQRTLSLNSSGTDAALADVTVWRGQKQAVNAAKQLLLTKAVATFEQTDHIFVGGMPLKVGRAGHRWYLVASDYGTHA